VEAADIMRRISQAERKLRARIRELDHSIGLSAVGHLIEELRQKYGDHPQVGEYLEAYKNDVLEHLDDFKAQEGEEQLPALLLAARRRDTLKYKVNLLVDNSEGQGAPVIYETNPTWYNLLGRVEYQNELGSFSTDFTKIRAGAFHRANGGYLILHATDLLANPLAWQALKRVLKTREILVESLADQYSSLALSTLRPEPVPLTTKVVLIGNPRLYQLLYH
jgi:predicted ATP-dependent protease